MENNGFQLVVDFDCKICPLQEDEINLIEERLINMAQELNKRGIEMKDWEVKKYGS